LFSDDRHRYTSMSAREQIVVRAVVFVDVVRRERHAGS
jgi:hypothetical protein